MYLEGALRSQTRLYQRCAKKICERLQNMFRFKHRPFRLTDDRCSNKNAFSFMPSKQTNLFLGAKAMNQFDDVFLWRRNRRRLLRAAVEQTEKRVFGLRRPRLDHRDRRFRRLSLDQIRHRISRLDFRHRLASLLVLDLRRDRRRLGRHFNNAA